MKIIVNKILPPAGYSAISLFGFILTRSSIGLSFKTINHESIHWQQQKELLIVPFFVWYLVEYLVRLVQYRNHDKAYRNISFEREAYANAANFLYIKERKRWAFIQVFRV
jgi:hypothetical protein